MCPFSVWVNGVQCVSELWPVCEWTVSIVWVNCVQCVSKLCPVCEWPVSSVWVNCVQFVSERYPVYEWTVFSVWVNCVQCVSELCQYFIHECSVWFLFFKNDKSKIENYNNLWTHSFCRTMTVATKHMLRLRIDVIFDIFLKVSYSCKIAVLKTLGYESEFQIRVRIRVRIRIQPFKN
jgi:hypothetical protein